jgi:hypothetical protein
LIFPFPESVLSDSGTVPNQNVTALAYRRSPVTTMPTSRLPAVDSADALTQRLSAREGFFVYEETTVKHLLQIAAISAALTACSMGTGILPAGPDTYTVTERRAPVLGGSTTAQQAAMTEANAFCAQQGRQFLPVDMVTPPSANPYGATGYSVTFRCLMPGDPELSGSHLAPTAIIEQRNR